MSKTDYAENKVLDWCVGRTLTAITAYVALYSSAPTDTTAGTEITGAGYARKATTGTDWGTPASGSVSNIAALDFPAATSNYPAPVTHFGILDAASAGNLILYGALGTAKTINSGETPRFAPGSLVLTED